MMIHVFKSQTLTITGFLERLLNLCEFEVSTHQTSSIHASFYFQQRDREGSIQIILWCWFCFQWFRLYFNSKTEQLNALSCVWLLVRY